MLSYIIIILFLSKTHKLASNQIKNWEKKSFNMYFKFTLYNHWMEVDMAERFLIFYVFQSPDYEPSLPVSEKSNPLTRDIDRASANCIVRMLQACDTQMFQEATGDSYQVQVFHKQWVAVMFLWQHSNDYLIVIFRGFWVNKWWKHWWRLLRGWSSFSRYHLSACMHFCWSVRHAVKAYLLFLQQDPQDSLVVLSGCGTSGRMAYLIAVKVVLKCSAHDLAQHTHQQ